jgi:hypothetical protein
MSEQIVETGTTETAPEGPKDSYFDLGVFAKRNAERGVWQFGVSPDGVDIVLWERKLGGVDDDLREHFHPGSLKQRADTYRREQLGLE